MYKLFLTIRYVMKPLSLVTVLALALSVTIFTFAPSIMNGFQDEFHARVRGTLSDIIVKGLRAVSDFESELQMAQMNHAISGVHTVFLPSASGSSFIASRLIREIVRFGGDVSMMVPEPVLKRLRDKYPDVE